MTLIPIPTFINKSIFFKTLRIREFIFFNFFQFFWVIFKNIKYTENTFLIIWDRFLVTWDLIYDDDEWLEILYDSEEEEYEEVLLIIWELLNYFIKKNFSTFFIFQNIDYTIKAKHPLSQNFKNYQLYNILQINPISNKLYTNKLYTNKWNNLWLIKLHSKILFYTKPYMFTRIFFTLFKRILLYPTDTVKFSKKYKQKKLFKNYHLGKKTLYKSFFLTLLKRKENKWKMFLHFLELKTISTRFRFRPGYSKLWRKARILLKQVFYINSFYQHKLTRKLNLLYKYSMANRITINQNTLYVLMISLGLERILYGITGVVYVNSFFVSTPFKKFQLYVQDWVQLEINWFYYKSLWNVYHTPSTLYFKTWRHWVFLLKRKRKKIQFKDYHRLRRYFENITVIKPQLFLINEVDYMVGSINILRLSLYWWEFNNLALDWHPYSDVKMYNWKYVT